MAKYFTNCETAEELKKAYREAARKLHPDSHPGKDTTEDFKVMQAEFETAWERLKNVHVNKDGETYEKETTETAGEFMDLINKLLKIPGVEVELCGSWIWITGNTKAAKDELKSYGFKFSRSKLAWYYHREPYHKRGSKKMTLDDIRGMYGSEKFTNSTGSAPGYADAIPAF